MRERNVKRRSGPSGTTKAPRLRATNAGRRQISVWLDEADVERLRELARGRTVREALEELIRSAPAPE